MAVVIAVIVIILTLKTTYHEIKFPLLFLKYLEIQSINYNSHFWLSCLIKYLSK